LRVEEMRAAGNFCSCPTPCDTSNYVPTASFSIVMGPETTAVLDDSATALRHKLFRARETTYRIDSDKWSATLRRFHAASRALARGRRHAEASARTMNDGYDTVDGPQPRHTAATSPTDRRTDNTQWQYHSLHTAAKTRSTDMRSNLTTTHQRHRQTDGRTDRQTAHNGNITSCIL